MAQFQLTLISADARYDRVRAGLDTFNTQEQRGYELFRTHCQRCHTEPLFTNGDFERNGLPADTLLRDTGRMRITGDPADSLAFKVPTLRNIEYSRPYMHDGRFRSLSQVLAFYGQNEALGITLSPEEQVDLMAFLLTLSDRKFLFNPDFGFPKRNP